MKAFVGTLFTHDAQTAVPKTRGQAALSPFFEGIIVNFTTLRVTQKGKPLCFEAFACEL
jgi:hypothetical protein